MAWWEDRWLPSATHNTFLSQRTILFLTMCAILFQDSPQYFSETVSNTFLQLTAILHQALPTISFADVESLSTTTIFAESSQLVTANVKFVLGCQSCST